MEPSQSESSPPQSLARVESCASAYTWKVLGIVVTSGGYGADACGLRLTCRQGDGDASLLAGYEAWAARAVRRYPKVGSASWHLEPFQPHRTPLMHASYFGDIDRLRKLISLGSKLDQRDETRHAALTYAVDADCFDAVHMLLEAGAKPELGEILVAIRDNNLDFLELLLSRNPDLNKREGDSGVTPLIEAIIRDDRAAARLLIEHNADVNFTSEIAVASSPRQWAVNWTVNGTPLQVAAQLGRSNMVQYLLEAGAEQVAHDFTGAPISLAKSCAFKLGTLDDLITLGIRYNREAELPTGLQQRPMEVIRLLLEHDEEYDVVYSDILFISAKGDVPVMAALLARVPIASDIYHHAVMRMLQDHSSKCLCTLLRSSSSELWLPESAAALQALIAHDRWCNADFTSALSCMLDLDVGIDADDLHQHCNMAMHKLDRGHRLQALQLILDSYPDLDVNTVAAAGEVHPGGLRSALHAICKTGSWPAVRLLLSKGAVPTGADLLTSINASEASYHEEDNDNNLASAIEIPISWRRERAEVVGEMLDRGADIDWRDPADHGNSVIEAACAVGEPALITVLLQRGAVVSTKAVVLACSGCEREVFEALLQHAKLDGDSMIDLELIRCIITDTTISGPLKLVDVACHRACASGYVLKHSGSGIVRLLMQRGFQPTPSLVFKLASSTSWKRFWTMAGPISTCATAPAGLSWRTFFTGMLVLIFTCRHDSTRVWWPLCLYAEVRM